MRQFRHKQTGNIAVETSTEKNYKVSQPQNYTVPKWIIENSSDWEEIIEKDYEILSFGDGVSIRGLNSFGPYYGKSIYSVKRLSDGEIFTIGDTCCMTSNTQQIDIIYEFDLTFGNFGVTFNRSGRWKLNSIEHYKTTLFTTEDGHEVRGAYTLFTVGVVESIDYSDYWKVTEIKYLGLNVPNLKDYKWFYLKSNAEKYIEENKPQFSKKDVLSYGKFFFTKGAFRTTILTVEELFNEYAEYKKLNK